METALSPVAARQGRTLPTLAWAGALSISPGRGGRHGTGLAGDLKTEKGQEGGEREGELVRGTCTEPREGINHVTVSFLLEENAGIVTAATEHEAKFHLISKWAEQEHHVAATESIPDIACYKLGNEQLPLHGQSQQNQRAPGNVSR